MTLCKCTVVNKSKGARRHELKAPNFFSQESFPQVSFFSLWPVFLFIWFPFGLAEFRPIRIVKHTHKKERILSLAQCLDRINVRDVCAAFKFIQGYTQKPLIIYFYFLFPLDFVFFHHVVVVVIVGLPRERERPLMEAKKQGRALQDRHWVLVGCGRPCDCTEIPSRGLCVCGDSPRGRQYFSLHFYFWNSCRLAVFICF